MKTVELSLLTAGVAGLSAIVLLAILPAIQGLGARVGQDLSLRLNPRIELPVCDEIGQAVAIGRCDEMQPGD